MTLQIGLYVPTWPSVDRTWPRWPEMRQLARDGESLGVHALWVADEPGFWECWTVLSAVAAVTDRVELGPLVACTTYRQPALLVTMARALDEVTAGRGILGLGSGVGPGDGRWTAFGWDGTAFVSRFAEAVEISARLLRSGPVAHEGRFYRLAQPDLGPAGPRPGGPPIWVAAHRPRTMEVAVRWGDAVNWSVPLRDRATVETFRAAVDAACATVDRDPAELALTGIVRLAPGSDDRPRRHADDTISGPPEAIAERLDELHAAGIRHLTCFIGDEEDERLYPVLTRPGLDRLAAVLERVTSLAPPPAPTVTPQPT